MAEIMNLPVDSLDRRRDRKDKSSEEPLPSSPPPQQGQQQQPPTQQPAPPPPPSRRRDRDDKERDRDLDRPPRRPDYYDRGNRSPPLAPRERGERGDTRDYKRRGSISPPPPPYRDRRHSPPRRSPPPPPFKRSRREDGGYDGRRGSPRGGFGPGADRRSGYDYASGYDREMGGRPTYADDRPHGRYAGRASGGYGPDWDSGRGAFGDASSTGTTQREGLMSYKQFIQELEDDILPVEAERRYQEYKAEYISTQKRAYFNAHKEEEWLKDKYHPTNLVTVIGRRNEIARKVAKDFLLELQSGSLDLGPSVNPSALNKSGHTSEPNSDDEADVDDKRRRHGREMNKENDILTAPKAHSVSSDPRRIQVDIEQAQALIRKLDSEKGIGENILCGSDNDKMNREKSHGGSSGPVVIVRGLTSVKGLEGVELLDTLITYLWRIHGADYYGMIESNEAKGLRHVRVEGKGSDMGSNGEWEKKLDLHWQERLQSQDPLEIMTAKDKIEAAAVQGLDPFVRKIRDEKYGWKYGCGAKGCTKLFHAAEFVHKHLKLKHPELLVDVTSKMREDLYFQNYMNDADAPGGTPVMQQSIMRDKPQRRRPGMENRLKDERGNRRERENRANTGVRFERSENMQQNEFESNNDGQDGGNHDEPMYDNFGGQGMHAGPPFPSDIPPPPVLMPVPGAGPLGPFVPAPPEVAMQMLREQGGPPPFEGNGRNMWPGPQMSGPSPILALSSAFRQDPRRLRSYQDLDAPEDEVTVIDYRSL